MQIQENISLKPYNTFRIDVKARYFSSFSGIKELEELLNKASSKQLLILGGGSNILLTGDFDGMVLKNDIRGIREFREDQEYVYVKAGAGENWHQFVMYCLERNWGGVENLSLIPGNVGAAPIQNIGAYGVELKEVFFDLEAFDLEEGKVHRFTLNDCEFSYRDSIFKNRYKGRFVILHVTFKLRKHPVFQISYGSIKQELENMGVKDISIQSISQAVIHIRSSKLPDPDRLPNAGSFFKNPVIDREKYRSLLAVFPGLTAFENPDGTVKLAAGWLIETCGWKGFRRGDAGCHERQALVLVNFGKASGREISRLSSEIKESVLKKFDVELQEEVNII